MMHTILTQDFIFNHVNDGIIITNIDGVIVDINQTWCLQLGYKQQELVGKHVLDIAKTSSKSLFENRVKTLRQEKKSRFFETTHVTKGGHRIPVEINTSLVTYKSKQYFISVVRDITAKKKIEEAFWLLATDQLQGVVITLNNTIVYANQKVADILAVPLESILNQPTQIAIGTYISPSHRQKIKTISDQFLDSEIRNIRFQLMIINALGKKLWVEVSTTKTNYYGKDALQSTFLNITEHKRAERLLKLLPQRIIRAHDREKFRLSRNIHDILHQQLVAHKINLQLVAKKPSIATKAELIGLVSQTQEIIDSVRQLAYEFRPPLLNEIGLIGTIKDVIEHLPVSQHRIKMVAKIKPNLPEPTANELFYILKEAIINSWRHSKAKEILVTIGKNKLNYVFSVQDNGIGIDEHTWDKSRHFGLEIMKERVKLIKASLTITSQAHQGTLVSVTLPIKK